MNVIVAISLSVSSSPVFIIHISDTPSIVEGVFTGNCTLHEISLNPLGINYSKASGNVDSTIHTKDKQVLKKFICDNNSQTLSVFVAVFCLLDRGVSTCQQRG